MPGREIVPNENSFHGVSQGSTATLELTRQNRLHQLDLYYTKAGVAAVQADIETDIEYIELKIGTAVQRTIYPVELFKLEAERNHAFRAGRIPIRLSDPSKRSILGEDATSWNLEALNTVTVRVKIKADVANVDPAIKAVPLKSPLARDGNGMQQEKQGLIITDRRIDVQTTDTSKVVTIMPEQGRQISSIHAFTDQITDVEVELPGRRIQKFTMDEVQGFQADQGFTPQADVFSLLGEAMTTRWADVENLGNLPLKIRFNLASVVNFNVIVKELGDRIR